MFLSQSVDQSGQIGGAGLGQGAGGGNHAGDDLEVVAGGEIAQGVVVGDELAAIGRDGSHDLGHLFVEVQHVGMQPGGSAGPVSGGVHLLE